MAETDTGKPEKKDAKEDPTKALLKRIAAVKTIRKALISDCGLKRRAASYLALYLVLAQQKATQKAAADKKTDTDSGKDSGKSSDTSADADTNKSADNKKTAE